MIWKFIAGDWSNVVGSVILEELLSFHITLMALLGVTSLLLSQTSDNKDNE